jgi:hypothetical protein
VLATYNLDITTKTPFVLYTNMDNELTVDVPLIKRDNIDLEISDGTISRTESGKFLARVERTGRVTVTAYHRKKNKLIGEVSFLVQDPPR